MDRRGWLASSAALAAAVAAWPGTSRGQVASREIADDAGRKFRVPARAARIFASGPPASILVFAVAPEALIGWTTPFPPAERPLVAPKYADCLRSAGSPDAATRPTSRSVAAKPDVIVVRTGRVHLAPAEPFGWIDFPPSINRLVGLRWLGRILYPDVFPEDLRPAVREFYTRCYHQAPTEAQLEGLIATAERAPPA